MAQVYVQWQNGESHCAGWRSCSDIGMVALDRSRERSCVHATAFCRATCFNVKLERVFPLSSRDNSNDIFWNENDGAAIAATLPRKATRARLMTRGEAFASRSDVAKVRAMCIARPEVLFLIPTRAWRSRVLRPLIADLRATVPNARILASIDPSNSAAEIAGLVADGWSVMFYGNDDSARVREIAEAAGARYVACQKTWHHVKGACAKCRNGCFVARPARPVLVHLKRH